jgi:hypothetical protein
MDGKVFPYRLFRRYSAGIFKFSITQSLYYTHITDICNFKIIAAIIYLRVSCFLFLDLVRHHGVCMPNKTKITNAAKPDE